MKRACLAVLLYVLFPTSAFAASCLPGSLASYIALGDTGCSVGSARFFNFTDQPVQPGATPIADSGTLVNPVDVAYFPGLRFDVDSDAAAGVFLQRIIGFSVTGASFTGNQVALHGSAVTPDGAVTAIEEKCIGQAFTAGGFCAGTSALLVAFDVGVDASLLESLAFTPATLLGVVVNIGVDGGTGGSAALGSATTQFTAVPEPATLALLGMGVVAGLSRRRYSR